MSKVTISKGNSKLKKVWNISLPPIQTCDADVPCTKLCYAMKAYRRLKESRNAWDGNLKLWEDNPSLFEASLYEQLQAAKTPISLFRWHVGGDIPDLRYLYMMCRIAGGFPEIKFLVFTKKYLIVNKILRKPANLSIILSAWPGFELYNPMHLPVAWMQDGTETRVPEDALECHGGCEECGLCWELPRIGKDVVFEVH